MDTLAALFWDRVARTPDRIAFTQRRPGGWFPMTWSGVGERVEGVAAGLLALGVQRGDRCAILCATRVEWILVDLGILCAGAATTTIYPSSTVAQSAHVLGDSGAVVCFVEDAGQLAKVCAAWDRLGSLRAVICLEPLPPGQAVKAVGSIGERRVLGLEELVEAGARWRADVAAASAGVGPEDLATLMYTSGTTGPAKGVVLVHDNWVYQAEVLREVSRPTLRDDDSQYLFLPLAHAFGKILELFAVAVGLPTFIDGDLGRILPGIRETRPTIVGAVPRIFEKAYDDLLALPRRPGWRWALEVGEEAATRAQRSAPPTWSLRARLALAERVALRDIRGWFGGRIRCFLSGGAPLAPEISRFFQRAGVWVLEGYGMTETAAATTGNRVEEFKFGTVGRPQPGAEVRIASDGEILIRHRGIMRGYHNLPEATAEVLDPQGWLRTGDLGRIGDDGYLEITGRKKDLIITSGGKNIAPQGIEGRIKASSRLISEVVMHGDLRPYCVALVWFDPAALAGWAREQGLGALTPAELAADPRVKARLWVEVERVNAELPSYETIKEIAVVGEPLAVETGELTPSMKVRRRAVEERYASLLSSLYPRSKAPER